MGIKRFGKAEVTSIYKCIWQRRWHGATNIFEHCRPRGSNSGKFSCLIISKHVLQLALLSSMIFVRLLTL
jgi:hypothetical protein